MDERNVPSLTLEVPEQSSMAGERVNDTLKPRTGSLVVRLKVTGSVTHGVAVEIVEEAVPSEIVAPAVNAALIVCDAATFVNVQLVTGPTVTPSTRTSSRTYPELGTIVNSWLAPCVTETAPEGEIVPFEPAEAVIV